MADAAFKVTVEVGGQQQPIDLQHYLRAHSPNAQLKTLDRIDDAEEFS